MNIFTIIPDVASGLTTFIFRKGTEILALKVCIAIRKKIKKKVAELVLKQYNKARERKRKRKLNEKFSVINNEEEEENFWVSLFTITRQDLLIFLILCFISPFETRQDLLIFLILCFISPFEIINKLSLY